MTDHHPRIRARTRRTLGLAAALLLALALPSAAQEPAANAPEGASGRTAKRAAHGREFMVVAANPLASEAGAAILQSGGNAIDAAIAVQAMLNLAEPQSSGLGGGAFLLYWDAGERRLTSFDARETAPLTATPSYFLKPDGTPSAFTDAVVGGRSVGVPGTPRLLATIHERYGSQPLAELVQPAVRRAEEGFPVSPRLAGAIADAATTGLSSSEAARALYFRPDGTPLRAGDTLKNPAFARTLRLFAERGAEPFYTGEVARDIMTTVRAEPANPGALTAEDFAAYQVKERAPVCAPYREVYQVCGMGPPSSGGLTVGQMLGLLGHFDLPGMGPGNPDAWHLFAEAAKLAYADRAVYMADPDFVRVPEAGLLDPAYLTSRAQLIDRDRAMPEAKAGNPPWGGLRFGVSTREEPPGTSHFVVVDRDGNAVSMTTTIEQGFGSRLVVRGFPLNNELTDFDFEAVEAGRPVANRVEGGKRPRSSMAPTIVLKDGRPFVLIGSPGGSRIIPYVAQALVAMLDWNFDPQAAIDLGHVVNRNSETTELETATPVARLADALKARGHTVRLAEQTSGLHAIRIDPDGLIGAADPRREGLALGR